MTLLESFDDGDSCWRDLTDVMAAGITRVLLYGPSGTGKTYLTLREIWARFLA